jgi:putative flippase GtrA
MPKATIDALGSNEAVRYAVNGLVATGAHYAVLRTGLEVFHFSSAGAANFVAALFGITTSFVGSRWYVFRQRSQPVLQQAARFATLYGAIACLHAALLFGWTDLWGFDYTIGFAIAIAVQISVSYFGNKYIVFAP